MNRRTLVWCVFLLIGVGTMKKFFKKFTATQKENAERGARHAVIEDLFYDFNRTKAQVYQMNFVRGIFFGFGSVVGGTLVVALLLWLLSLLVDLPGGVGDFVRYIVELVRAS